MNTQPARRVSAFLPRPRMEQRTYDYSVRVPNFSLNRECHIINWLHGIWAVCPDMPQWDSCLDVMTAMEEVEADVRVTQAAQKRRLNNQKVEHEQQEGRAGNARRLKAHQAKAKNAKAPNGELHDDKTESLRTSREPATTLKISPISEGAAQSLEDRKRIIEAAEALIQVAKQKIQAAEGQIQVAKKMVANGEDAARNIEEFTPIVEISDALREAGRMLEALRLEAAPEAKSRPSHRSFRSKTTISNTTILRPQTQKAEAQHTTIEGVDAQETEQSSSCESGPSLPSVKLSPVQELKGPLFRIYFCKSPELLQPSNSEKRVQLEVDQMTPATQIPTKRNPPMAGREKSRFESLYVEFGLVSEDHGDYLEDDDQPEQNLSNRGRRWRADFDSSEIGDTG